MNNLSHSQVTSSCNIIHMQSFKLIFHFHIKFPKSIL